MCLSLVTKPQEPMTRSPAMIGEPMARSAELRLNTTFSHFTLPVLGSMPVMPWVQLVKISSSSRPDAL